MTPNQAISYERRSRAKEMLEDMMTTPDNTFIGRAQEASAQRKADNRSGILDPNEELKRILAYSAHVAQK